MIAAILTLCLQGTEIGPDHLAWSRTNVQPGRAVWFGAGGSELWNRWDDGGTGRLTAYSVSDGATLMFVGIQDGAVDVAADTSLALVVKGTAGVSRVLAYTSADSTPLWTNDFAQNAAQVDVAVSDDGTLAVAGSSATPRLVLLDAVTGSTLGQLDGVGWNLELSADGARVAVVDDTTATVRVLSLPAFTTEFRVEVPSFGGHRLSDDGGTLLVLDAGVAKLYQRAAAGQWQATPTNVFVSQFGRAGLALDGQTLFVAREGIGTVTYETFDIATGNVLAARTDAGTDPYAVAVDRTGTRFIAAQDDGPLNTLPQALVFDAALNRIGDLNRPDLAFEVAISPDGRLAAVTGYQFTPVSTSGEVFLLDLDQAPLAYCVPKASSKACVAQLAGSAPATRPVSGKGDYAVLATGVQSATTGLFFYGLQGPADQPFLGGFLCVQGPLLRTPPGFATGVGDCGGAPAIVVNGGLAPLDPGPGGKIWMQYWFRDPLNGPGNLGTALSDGLEVTFE